MTDHFSSDWKKIAGKRKRMNKTTQLILSALIFTATAHAQMVYQSHWNYSITTTVSGQKYSQKLSSDDLPDYPVWNIQTEPCPLPASNAVLNAHTALLHILPEKSEPELKAITLKTLLKDIWLYEVSFLIPGPAEGEKTGCTILVGLDGTVPALTLKTAQEVMPTFMDKHTAEVKSAPAILTPEQDQTLVEEDILTPVLEK